MFICSLKPKEIFSKALLLALAAILLIVSVHLFSSFRSDSADPPVISQTHERNVPDNAARISFLKSFGWEVSAEPIETVDVVIPQTFGKVYQNYNEIQTAQGFDLSKYRGKQVKRYTYAILNYPNQKEYIRANLLVFENQVIAGDVCSVYAENGFMHGFAYPQKEEES